MAKKSKKGGILSPLQIQKKYPGSGIATSIAIPSLDTLWIPSRCLPLNYATGGGIPYGKILEIYGQESSGKTLAALDFGSVVQALGGEIMYNDAEMAFTIDWAIKNGLDPNKIHLYPETSVELISDWIMDTAISIRARLVKNEPILFIQDSIAALDCMANINSSQTDSKAEMGNRAKAIYKMVRIRNQMLAEMGVTSIFINQIRSNIKASTSRFSGVDPDCLHYNTLVHLVDGRTLPIGEIVRGKIAGEVWSYNETTLSVEPKPIIGWVEKEKLEPGEKWLSIVTNGPGSKGGKFGIVCTEKHGIFTAFKGWVNARDLKVGDMVLTYAPYKINGTLRDFLEGSAIGDSSIRVRDTSTARYRLQDSEQPEYLQWKLNLLSEHYSFKAEYDSQLNIRFTTDYSTEWAIFGAKFPNRNPSALFCNTPNALTMAVWYMDDGHLSDSGIISIAISPKRVDLQELAEWLSGYGYICKPYKKGIRFSNDGGKRLHRLIAKYVPECMAHKLKPEYQGMHEPFGLTCHPEITPLPTKVVSINGAGERHYRKLHKYDLTIQDNHSFFAGSVGPGFLVHNTTPGGQAMKFFASIRLGIYAGRQIKEKVGGYEDRVGSETSVRVKKNKVAPPKPTFKAKMYFNPDYEAKPLGFDRYFGLGELLIRTNVLSRKPNSSMIYLDGTLIARGEKSLDLKLAKDAKLRRALIKASSINTVSKTRNKLNGLSHNLYPVKTKKFISQLNDEENEDE
jgi:recombination protein RecA